MTIFLFLLSHAILVIIIVIYDEYSHFFSKKVKFTSSCIIIKW